MIQILLALALITSSFSGKFELVPLFHKDHTPYVRNGHQYYAERNNISFRTAAGDTVTAFAGSTTDLASIPSFVWPILPPDGPWAEGAAIHDACYKSRGSFDWGVHHGRTRLKPYDRGECDEILRETMIVLDVTPWKREVIYEAVRLGGSKGWGS